jgi:hypothetical protein
MLATTRPLCGSIRNTCLLSLFETHNDPNPVASHAGPAGTRILSTIGSAASGDCQAASGAAAAADSDGVAVPSCALAAPALAHTAKPTIHRTSVRRVRGPPFGRPRITGFTRITGDLRPRPPPPAAHLRREISGSNLMESDAVARNRRQFFAVSIAGLGLAEAATLVRAMLTCDSSNPGTKIRTMDDADRESAGSRRNRKPTAWFPAWSLAAPAACWLALRRTRLRTARHQRLPRDAHGDRGAHAGVPEPHADHRGSFLQPESVGLHRDRLGTALRDVHLRSDGAPPGLFLPLEATHDMDSHADVPGNRVAVASTVVLCAGLAAVVLSTELLAPSVEAAVRAARRNRLQTSLNLSVGSALASIGFTIPAVAIISVFAGWTLVLGLDSKETVLLVLSLFVASLTLNTGRTTVLPGAAHLVIFAVYLFTVLVP